MSPRPSAPEERHHAQFLTRVALTLFALDVVAGVQAIFSAPEPWKTAVASTLPVTALCALASYVSSRRGSRTPALWLLVATQLVTPAVITLRAHETSDVSVLTVGVWCCPAILIASAFFDRRAMAWLGMLAALSMITTVTLLKAWRCHTAFESLIFVATLTALVALAAGHRDALDALRQAALVQRNDELQHLKDTLEHRVAERTEALLGTQKMAVIGRLTAGIAHEMSSPLAAILASVEGLGTLIAEYEASIGVERVEPEDHRAIVSEMQEALGIARMASERSAAFVRSIKAQTRVSLAGQVEAFDPTALVQDCIHLLAHAARAARCKMTLRSDGVLRMRASPSRLGQAVTNLLQNAIDATGERGGGEIFVEITRGPNRVVIQIRDAAGGIPDDVLPRIFEPLFTTKPYGRGTGLGLAIVKEAVEQDLGGQVRVRTQPGTGTTFTLDLPTECAVRGEEHHHAA